MIGKRYLDRAEAIQARRDKDLQALGAEIRKTIVEPLCKKHNLRFLSGNGEFFFIDEEDNSYRYAFDLNNAPKKIQKPIKAVMDLLNMTIAYNDYLGYYVENVENGVS